MKLNRFLNEYDIGYSLDVYGKKTYIHLNKNPSFNSMLGNEFQKRYPMSEYGYRGMITPKGDLYLLDCPKFLTHDDEIDFGSPIHRDIAKVLIEYNIIPKPKIDIYDACEKFPEEYGIMVVTQTGTNQSNVLMFGESYHIPAISEQSFGHIMKIVENFKNKNPSWKVLVPPMIKEGDYEIERIP